MYIPPTRQYSSANMLPHPETHYFSHSSFDNKGQLAFPPHLAAPTLGGQLGTATRYERLASPFRGIPEQITNLTIKTPPGQTQGENENKSPSGKLIKSGHKRIGSEDRRVSFKREGSTVSNTCESKSALYEKLKIQIQANREDVATSSNSNSIAPDSYRTSTSKI